jgi:hypothetical protein
LAARLLRRDDLIMKYRAIAPVTLQTSAVVKLTAEQFRRRRHLVKATKADGWYEVMAGFQFKTGEEFETEQGMSKADTVAIGPEESQSAPPQAPSATVAATQHASSQHAPQAKAAKR